MNDLPNRHLHVHTFDHISAEIARECRVLLGDERESMKLLGDYDRNWYEREDGV